MPRSAAIVLAGLVITSTACSGESSAESTQVITTFGVVDELVHGIVQNPDAVTTLASDVEPHDMEITAAQATVIDDAALMVYLGGDFQPAVQSIATQMSDGRSLDLLDGLDAPTLDDDPHVWLDPAHMLAMADVIAAELERVGIPTTTTSEFVDDLRELDAEFTRGLGTCPSRLIVTGHAAFAALAERLGLEQAALEGTDPADELTPAGLDALAKRMDAENVTTVFSEPDDAEVAAFAEQTGRSVLTLHTLESMSPQNWASGRGYGALQRENLASLREGLGCT